MTTLSERLAELSGKATPGPWRVGRQDGSPADHIVDMGKPPKAPFMALHNGRPDTAAMRGWADFGVLHSNGRDTDRDIATAALIVELVNAYRAGRLIVKDEAHD